MLPSSPPSHRVLKAFMLYTQEEREVTTGKGSTAHFVWRCGLCKRESSAKFEPSEKPKPYSADANGQFAPFITIDCRGLEFTGFDPKVGALLFTCGWSILI